MSHYIASTKPLCVPVGVVKPRKTGGSKQHIHQQRKAKITCSRSDGWKCGHHKAVNNGCGHKLGWCTAQVTSAVA
jgi:hypothetical protein